MADTGHPGRPDHPDFWLMAGITTRNDEAAREATPVPLLVQDAGVDPTSAIYLAQNRAVTVAAISTDSRVSGAALWLDGLLVGLELARKRAEVDDLEKGM